MTSPSWLALCALLQTPAAQVPAPAPSAASSPAAEHDGDAAGWTTLDRVVIVVNDDIVTRGQLSGRYALALRNGLERPKTQAEQDAFVSEIAHDAIVTRLKAQAGEALGFDPAQVERIQKNDLERAIKARGGVVNFSEFLSSRGITAEDFRLMRRDFIFTELWEDAITGSGASVSSRPSSDRYVRPGLIRFEYENAKLDPALLAEIGGRAETVHFRWLLLIANDESQLPVKLNLAQQLRAQIVDGADMEGVVENYSRVRGKDSDITTELATALRVVPQAAAFFRTARPGDVSDPMPYRSGEARGYALYRLEDRKPSEVPPLDSLEVQQKLARRLQTDFDQQRIEAALQRAWKNSYVWQMGANDAPAAPKPAAAGAEGVPPAAPGGTAR